MKGLLEGRKDLSHASQEQRTRWKIEGQIPREEKQQKPLAMRYRESAGQRKFGKVH